MPPDEADGDNVDDKKKTKSDNDDDDACSLSAFDGDDFIEALRKTDLLGSADADDINIVANRQVDAESDGDEGDALTVERHEASVVAYTLVDEPAARG